MHIVDSFIFSEASKIYICFDKRESFMHKEIHNIVVMLLNPAFALIPKDHKTCMHVLLQSVG